MPVISTIAAATARAFGAFKSLGGAADEFFDYVTLLLHGDGTNGAQNNTFLDSSTNNFTITRNGNTTQGTFSPFSQDDGKWGAYFDGSGDYLRLPSSTAWNFGTGDFTIEFWVYPIQPATSAGETYYPFVGTDGSFTNGSTYNWLLLYVNQGGLNKLRFVRKVSTSGGGGDVIIDSSTFTLNTNAWVHIAVVRQSGIIYFYVNGVATGSASYSSDISNTQGLVVNAMFGGATFQSVSWTPLGYTSNLRIVKSAVYTSAFTPSTTPLTAISGTSLLTCQSNRFVDNSANAFAITVNGNTSIQPFSPFAPSAAYDAAVNGGSGYFDGGGDYLSVADNSAFEFGSGDFCVEFFAYVTATDSSGTIFVSQWSSPNRGWIFGYVNSGTTLNFDYSTTGSNAVSVNASVSLPLNQWAHFAACRSGNTLSTYMNGSRVATASVTGVTIFAPNQPLEIGRNPEATTAWDMIGYLSGMRIVKGSSVYDPTQTTITVPTAPPTAISNTSVLLNYTNAGILDNTGRNALETVGNAQISTSVKKFGTGSLAFDGTGDYLLLRPSQQLIFEGDFTIEFWLYITLASSTYHSPIGNYNGNGTTNWQIEVQNTGVIRLYYNGSSSPIVSASGVITNETWQHIAAVRSGSTVALYVNGSQIGTASFSGALGNTTTNTLIASIPQNTTQEVVGYIDDLRITKGVARYTSNFTPPTAAFADQ